MKTNLLRAAALGLALTLGFPVQAADAPAKTELQALVTKVRTRLAAGQNTATALAPELAEFDVLAAKYRGEKSEDAAQILVTQASLYAQVLEDENKAIEILQQIPRDFAGTAAAANADRMIASMKRQLEAARIERSLAIGAKFPDFAEPDLSGSTVSLSNYRGKVVLIDFWATWCGPCITELPHVLAAYNKHNKSGFDIVGISLDQASARQKLIDFTKVNEMPWPQIFDGNYWQSKLAVKYGVTSIPATYLIDRNGNIAAKDLRGPALEQEVARLLAAP